MEASEPTKTKTETIKIKEDKKTTSLTLSILKEVPLLNLTKYKARKYYIVDLGIINKSEEYRKCVQEFIDTYAESQPNSIFICNEVNLCFREDLIEKIPGLCEAIGLNNNEIVGYCEDLCKFIDYTMCEFSN